MGFRIFQHSIDLVFKNLSDAFRVSGALYLLGFALSIIGLLFFMPTAGPGQAANFPLQYVVILFVVSILYLWIAVSWHRFVLLDEHPASVFPNLHGDRMLAYFGRMLQAGLILAVAGAIVGVGLGILVMITQGSPVFAVSGAMVLFTLLLVVSYRLAPVFPGAAIGRPIGISAAWTATSGSSGAIAVLAIVSAIASVVIDLPTLLLQHVPAGGIFVAIWLNVTAWVKLMVGISILTTLYGVYVEKRQIT